MPLRREISAVSDVLSSPANEDKTADEVSEEAIKALDELRARTHRLAVITNYAWRVDEEPHLAFIGPFSTRSTSAAKAAGEAMAGTPRGGVGKWMTVPAYANARTAWAAMQPEGKDEKRAREFLESIRAAHGDTPSIWDPLAPPLSGATCACGLNSGGYCHRHEKRTPSEQPR